MSPRFAHNPAMPDAGALVATSSPTQAAHGRARPRQPSIARPPFCAPPPLSKQVLSRTSAPPWAGVLGWSRVKMRTYGTQYLAPDMPAAPQIWSQRTSTSTVWLASGCVPPGSWPEVCDGVNSRLARLTLRLVPALLLALPAFWPPFDIPSPLVGLMPSLDIFSIYIFLSALLDPLLRWGADIGKMGGLRLRTLLASDSITYGYQNQWRPHCRQDAGNYTIVDTIGSEDSGPFRCRDRGFLLPDLPDDLNVVLLLPAGPGTNDINNGDDIDDAPARFMAVVDITSDLPTAAVLVGTLPLNGNAAMQVNVGAVNYNITQMLLRRFSDGAIVYAVPMENIGPDNMADGLHPSHDVMADCWFSMLWQVAEWGWIDPATGDLPGDGSDVDCSNNPREIANGAGLGPNGGLCDCTAYVEDPSECGYLNSDGRAEYLWLDTAGVTTAFLNLGSSGTGGGSIESTLPRSNAAQIQWLPSGVIATGVGAPRHQVLFSGEVVLSEISAFLMTVDLTMVPMPPKLLAVTNDGGVVELWINGGAPTMVQTLLKSFGFPKASSQLESALLGWASNLLISMATDEKSIGCQLLGLALASVRFKQFPNLEPNPAFVGSNNVIEAPMASV
ncbi:hypothetical protein K438DRAFT_1981643 [Mycena galopus ATCC 62051]|nr:hypothetical protein K438DRAFT_1981643 [Mycena galopus ATCC 62051]